MIQTETLVLEENEDVIAGYYWSTPNRIIYLQDQGGNENYHLFAINIDGTDKIELTPFEGVRAMVIANLKQDKEHIIIQMNKDNPQVFEPYKLNIINGN